MAVVVAGVDLGQGGPAAGGQWPGRLAELARELVLLVGLLERELGGLVLQHAASHLAGRRHFALRHQHVGLPAHASLMGVGTGDCRVHLGRVGDRLASDRVALRTLLPRLEARNRLHRPPGFGHAGADPGRSLSLAPHVGAILERRVAVFLCPLRPPVFGLHLAAQADA